MAELSDGVRGAARRRRHARGADRGLHLEPARPARQADGRAQRARATTTAWPRCSTTPCRRASCARSTAPRCTRPPRRPTCWRCSSAGGPPRSASGSIEPSPPARVTPSVPRMRRIALAAAMLGSCGAAAGAALAADQEVAARNIAFTPGDGGRCSRATRSRSATTTARSSTTSSSPTSRPAARRRARAGRCSAPSAAAEQRDAPYDFFCSLHPGMSGRVYVNATGHGADPVADRDRDASTAPHGHRRRRTATATATATAGPAGPRAPARRRSRALPPRGGRRRDAALGDRRPARLRAARPALPPPRRRGCGSTSRRPPPCAARCAGARRARGASGPSACCASAAWPPARAR